MTRPTNDRTSECGALSLNLGWPITLLPVVLVAVVIGVIRREERHLAAVLRAEYDAYRQRVRRWV